MKPEDLKAVEASITDKWHRLTKREFYTHISIPEPECNLCMLQYERYFEEPKSECGNCVIKQFTGLSQCDETPYYTWRDYFIDLRYIANKENITFTTLEMLYSELVISAKKEIEFLLQFLPEGYEFNTEDGVIYKGTGEAYNKLTEE